jgi:murein DD-endopeptidase MepM/ murein hydrolase activator NlpD
MANAAHIMNAAVAMKLPLRAQQIGVMTSMGESSLVNIGYGDWETSGVTNPDGSPTTSIGLFQQQNNWGSTADRMDPEKAATMFFQRLVDVSGWEQMDPSHAAHAVQINSDANYYTKFWDQAVALTDELARTYGSGVGGGGCTAGQAAYPLNQPFVMTDDFGPRDAPTEGASSWHPAVDLVGHCGDPIFAVLPGTVTRSDRLWLSIQSPDGFTISYLHSHKADRSVNVGDQVQRGQQISKVGDESPATGCHLDLRIDTTGNKNPTVAQLPTYPEAPGFVNPEDFMKLFGVELCPTSWCTRNY